MDADGGQERNSHFHRVLVWVGRPNKRDHNAGLLAIACEIADKECYILVAFDKAIKSDGSEWGVYHAAGRPSEGVVGLDLEAICQCDLLQSLAERKGINYLHRKKMGQDSSYWRRSQRCQHDKRCPHRCRCQRHIRKPGDSGCRLCHQ